MIAGFYATAPWTAARAVEEKIAEERSLELREVKPIEAAALALLPEKKEHAK